MSNEYVLGSITMFAGKFAPKGWAFCDGQLMQIAQYPELFSILGTTYGGDGTTTFALPDLRGRAPLHRSAEMKIGSKGGEEQVKLTAAQVSHRHDLRGTSGAASSASVKGLLPAKAAVNAYQTSPAEMEMSRKAVSEVGGNQPHNNMQPFICLNFIINIGGYDGNDDGIIGEVRIFAFGFAPSDWMSCEGQIISISQETALYSILGVVFGGNGSTNFALPDLRARVPVDDGAGIGLTNRVLGARGGESVVTLTPNHLPGHSHVVKAAGAAEADSAIPANNGFGKAAGLYAAAENLVEFNSGAVGVTGGNSPHNNMQPSLALNYCICMRGMYPTRG